MARGKLRIYLGAAPGVGKTYAMLDEGWRRHQRGTDVVIGIVITHGRPKTEAQIRDVEVVPPQRIEYRGATFEEMDVDAVVARRPAQVLVDELAHTNVPGAKHQKRWQDIEEILDHGIDVISTVNIQHLESLNDVVNQITGVVQRETVPDAFVRSADAIELVDMSPEALRRRLAHGNIYAPEKVDAALSNYFRVGNLAALRELALLWVADRVEDSLQSYMAQHGITGTWETRERVVVTLTGAPGGDQLIRRAARMATRSKGDLLGVNIRTDDGLTRPPSELLARHRELLAELGGTYHQATGNDVPTTLVEFAKAEHATQLVLGTSRRSRWTELTRGSVINKVIRLAAPLDVHVISTENAEEPAPRLLPRVRVLSAHARRRIAIGLVVAVAGLAGLTPVLSGHRSSVQAGEGLLVYLAVVAVVAGIGGPVPAVACAAAAVALDDWFLVRPYGSLTVEHGADLGYLAAFIVVSVFVVVLVEMAAARRLQSARARFEADALLSLAERFSATVPIQAVLDQIHEVFQRDSVTLFERQGEDWSVAGVAGDHPVPDPEAGERIDLAGGMYALVLRGAALPASDRRVLFAFAAHLDAMLQMQRLRGRADTADQLAQANDLRTALLAAVSHDLRTPLASIKASATSLLADDVRWSEEQTREFLQTIDVEADRLNTLVGNLLDMSRLQTGALQLNVRPVGLDEVVPAALAGLGHRSDRVTVEVPETLPLVEADPALLERAVANIVHNAIAHSGVDRPIRVEAGEVAGRVDLRVVDRGSGIPEAAKDQVFLPFQRLGDKDASGGVGLGLAVAKGFVEAMGGELALEDTPGGGVTMVISLRPAGAHPVAATIDADHPAAATIDAAHPAAATADGPRRAGAGAEGSGLPRP